MNKHVAILLFALLISIASYLLIIKDDPIPIITSIEIIDYSPNLVKKSYKEAKHAYSKVRTYTPDQSGTFYSSSRCEDSKKGCIADTQFSFKAPKEPGMYWVLGKDLAGDEHKFPINVVDTASAKKACLLVSSFTEQAYNRKGGKSFYSSPYTEPITLSLNRPLSNPGSNAHGHIYPTISFLKDLGKTAHIFDDLYLHNDGIDLTKSCKYLILSGHSEYWTQKMLDSITKYVRQGGNVANFSSNYGYWLVTLSDDQSTITVDKTKSNIKINRLDKKHAYIKEMLGIYYLGYPVERYAENEALFKEKYPVLSNVPELDYEGLRTMNIEDRSHPVFSCLDPSMNVLQDTALKIEVDGKLLVQYKKEDPIPKIYTDSKSIDGALLTAWAVYGKNIRKIVVARDLATPYDGRIVSFGSIGWLNVSLREKITREITMNTLALFENTEYQCT